MENQSKLLATESSRSQGVCQETLVDRFSALPDEISLHILSSLDHQGLTRVGAVSKRFNDLYLSTPSFRIDSSSDIIQRKTIIMNCFDQFMRRRGNNKVRRFGIELRLQKSLASKVPQIMSWIDTAARCSVEVLDIRLRIVTKHFFFAKRPSQSTEGFLGAFPSCIFRCGSLKVLSLSMFGSFNVPSVLCPNNLQSLSLSSVELNEGFSNWISSSCKNMKELKLEYVWSEHMTIESSSIESLIIESSFHHRSNFRDIKIAGEKLKRICIKFKFYDAGSRSLHICAPNLKYIKWTGEMLSHPNFGEFSCLEKAEIFLESNISDNVFDYPSIFEFLCSIRKVKELVVSERTIQTLFREGSMAAPIFDTSYLRIYTTYLDNSLIPEMVSLMRGMSNLSILDIKSDLFLFKSKACGFDVKYWKSQNLDFVNQLEEITIEFSNGNNSWQLARFILEHARNLKKMVIFYIPGKHHVIEKVNNSKKVSSATIHFHERIGKVISGRIF